MSDRRRIVGNHQFVVHAPVDSAEVENEVETGPPTVGERVEQTNLDIGVGIEGGDNRIVGLVVGIVDEQAHLDPAIGTVEGLFQYRSNTRDRSPTTGPTANTSRSR